MLHPTINLRQKPTIPTIPLPVDEVDGVTANTIPAEGPAVTSNPSFGLHLKASGNPVCVGNLEGIPASKLHDQNTAMMPTDKADELIPLITQDERPIANGNPSIDLRRNHSANSWPEDNLDSGRTSEPAHKRFTAISNPSIFHLGDLH